MNEHNTSPIGFFQKYLTVWVILCMAVGICIGKFLPQIPEFLNRFEYARVLIPMAILIWVMIYPMMMKVDFRSIKNVGKNPKGCSSLGSSTGSSSLLPCTAWQVCFSSWCSRRSSHRSLLPNILPVQYCWVLCPARQWSLCGAH